jgi:phosphonate transport system substrate-binding protein
MQRSAVRLGWPAAAVLAIGACQSPGLRFISLITLREQPFVIALVSEKRPVPASNPLDALNPFSPYEPLQAALSRELRRPVAMDLCFPLQLEPCLSSGLYHAAIVSAAQYAGLSRRERFPVIAIAARSADQPAHPALLVVPAGSPIGSVEELRGKIVAFGPMGDSHTHYAALDLLSRHGLKPTDLSLEPLPVPGSLKHMPHGRAVLQSVVNGSSDAGFVEEPDFNELPAHADQADELARDRLRIIARTEALPEQLLIGSPELDADTIARAREFLLSLDRTHPEVLRPLRIGGYQPATDDVLQTCGRLRSVESPVTRPGGTEGD